MTRSTGLAAGAFLFIVVATANSGGYRYGISDQAFYVSAVVKDLHPSFFPRDGSLIETESGAMWTDEILASLARVVRVDLPPLFFALYLITLVTLFAGAVSFARAAGFSWWAVAVFILLLTLRHRIARTATNSLEGYMHPRELSFALGVVALACLVRGRQMLAGVCLLLAACWHPTTGAWFGVILAASVAARIQRRHLVVPGIAAAGLAIWAVLWGPLAARLVIMDPAWLAVLGDKDYLFPHQWPVYAWTVNLAYPVIILFIARRRRQLGCAVPGEPQILLGVWLLVGIFLLSLPLTTWRLALSVQLQVTRVFWVLDFMTVAYLAWWIADDLLDRRGARRVVIVILAAFSIGRGYDLSFVQPGRQLFAIGLPKSDWIEAMDWLRTQPAALHVLADPGHTWKYGPSVRVAAQKDTLIEAGKDSAIAIYDRSIAMRVANRLAAVGDFDRLDATAARALAVRYGLDVIVARADRPIELPVLHRNSSFVVFDLR